MTHYDVTPNGSASPKVRLYNDSLDRIPRTQTSEVVRHGVIENATPASDSDGLHPADINFHGFWLGNNASQLADALRADFYDDPTVTRVDVQAVNTTGTSQNSPYNGTYRIADDSSIDRPVSDEDRIWEYTLLLVED